MVLVEYTGNGANTHKVVGKATGTGYRFGNSDEHRIKYVYKADVPFLESLRFYKPVGANGLESTPASPLIVREREHAH